MKKLVLIPLMLAVVLMLAVLPAQAGGSCGAYAPRPTHGSINVTYGVSVTCSGWHEVTVTVHLNRRQPGGQWTFQVDGFQRTQTVQNWNPTKNFTWDCRKDYMVTMGWVATPGNWQGSDTSSIMFHTC